MSMLASSSRSLPLQKSLPQTATRGEWVSGMGTRVGALLASRSRQTRLFDLSLWNVGLRRNLAVAVRSGEGPFNIRFADFRYRAVQSGGLLA
jgi:hypothetical protein